MAIQMRRGLRKDFDPEKMLPGEWAVSTDTNTQNQIVWMCFAPGVVKRMGTYEDFKAQIEEASGEIVQNIETSAEEYISGKVDEEYIPALEEYVTRAETAATNAETSEQAASSSATTASEKATAAGQSATTATEKADAANTSAQNAQQSATAAASSATEAEAAETNAKNWAVGPSGSGEGTNTNNSKYYAQQAQQAVSSIVGALIPKGTIAFSDLSTVEKKLGYLYNISDTFTTTDDFMEGEGKPYPAGTNVYYTDSDKWDCLAGNNVVSVNGQTGIVNLDIVSPDTLEIELNKKVDVVQGKGLSEKDFTATDETKLDGIEEGAQKNPTGKQGQVVGFDENGAAKAVDIESLKTISDLKAYIGYTESDILGLQVDYKNKTFTRLAGAQGKTAGDDFDSFAMYGGRKRCNVSKDGTITKYYGEDGYTEGSKDSQVMVYQPKFYYKVVPLELEKNTVSGIGFHIRKANYYVSATPHPGFKLHPLFYDENGLPVEYVLLSAYEGSMYDASATKIVDDGVDTDIAYADGDLLCSVGSQKPISGLRTGMGTKDNFENMAKNRGTGWHLETIQATCANILLMMIELGTMDSQTGIANGVVSIADNSSYNCSSLTGSTATLGNTTGSATETTNKIGSTTTKETINGKVSISYRGVENPWGNIWKHIQGINIWGNGKMSGGQPYICSNFDFNESKNSDNYKPVGFTLANANGYINAMGYGSEEYDWLLIPSETGGTNALPVGDYLYLTPNLSGYRIVRLGGCWLDGLTSGAASWSCLSGVGYLGRNVGGRLLYIPNNKTT